MRQIKKMMMAVSMAILLSLPQITLALETGVVVEKPSALAMTGDALIARPVGAVITVVGAAVFLVSLPFSLLGGNTGEAAKTLVVGPAKTTFVRCLGCEQPGYKKTVQTVEGQ